MVSRVTPKNRVRAGRERDMPLNYRSLVEQMQEGIAVLHLRPLRIVFANKALATLGGYGVREFSALGPEATARCIHPEDRATVLGHMRNRLKGGGAPSRYKCRIVRKDGTVRHVEISSRRVVYDGTPAVQATFIDRTRERASEDKLKLLSQVVEQVSEGVAVLGSRGEIIYANRTMAAMHGYATGYLIGRRPAVFHTPAQMPMVKAALAKTVSTGAFSGEIWHARRDGTCFPSLMQTTLLHDANGKAIGIVGTCRDITEIKKAADELARSKDEKALILDSVEESITYKDSRMRIVWANRSAARQVGVTPRELLGRHCHEVWHGNPRPCPNCPGLITMRTGEASWGEHVGEGGRRYLIGTYPVKNAEGKITGSVEMAVKTGDCDGNPEMDTLRSFSKMLIDLQEEERKRIALELHDQVGQGLTAAKIFLRRVERKCGRDGHPAMPEFADAIALIDTAVNDVRTISHRLRPAAIDILGLVPALGQLVKSLAGKSGVAIEFTARGIRGKVDTRIEIALYRVVQEAINNALKYSGCTRIDVGLSRKGRMLALHVADDGRGFALLRAGRMMGLGLTGMRERIEGVGGTFAIKSGLGEGTRIDALVPFPAVARRGWRGGTRA